MRGLTLEVPLVLSRRCASRPHFRLLNLQLDRPEAHPPRVPLWRPDSWTIRLGHFRNAKCGKLPFAIDVRAICFAPSLQSLNCNRANPETSYALMLIVYLLFGRFLTDLLVFFICTLE